MPMPPFTLYIRENINISRLKERLYCLVNENTDMEVFKSFQKSLGQILIQQDNTPKKLYVILQLYQYGERLGLEDNDRIMQFLNRCYTRIQTPFSEDVTMRLEYLKVVYSNIQADHLQQYKLKFLQQFQTYVVAHPEISYKDCLQQVKQILRASNEGINFKQTSNFFIQHRFNDLINDIVNNKNDLSLVISEVLNPNHSTRCNYKQN